VKTLRPYVGEFRDNWRDPAFWREAPAFLWRHVLTAPLRRIGWAYRRRRSAAEQFTVADADWDNCLLLDACRYDAFEALTDPDWDLRPRLAAGSDTGGFLASNYPPDATEPDLVYVNANPRVAAEPTGDFHAIEHVWQSRWDDEYDTVLPEATRDAALEAHDRYPRKRLFVHFLQPHIPYVGETAEKLPGGAAVQGMRPDAEVEEAKPYAAVEAGLAAPETVRTAYRESLERALAAVEELVAALPGKTAITADHGDLLGEREARVFGEFSAWGHPAETPVEPLVSVPWSVPPYDERKDVRAGSATDTNRSEPPREQLGALGYE
jgi:hypothetical protein